MTIQEMASLGGKASAKKRLVGKTQSEISQIMRTVRMSKANKKKLKEMGEASVESLKKY